eukprot:CAMPEP_0182423770 /NCGR_PEP_ID=MMETSP1167-20130531/9856_1 /TAXON_ID=2988 /ORGANISM="Mallomonas Sp, Strain CCMP3275" /LENGTH=67 /DNA_ID=CAMNT_0024603043 /DNA_START=692 /DNA_END=895 /DNA_ORIENTATION=-
MNDVLPNQNERYDLPDRVGSHRETAFVRGRFERSVSYITSSSLPAHQEQDEEEEEEEDCEEAFVLGS